MRQGFTRYDRVTQWTGVAQGAVGASFTVFADDYGFGILLMTVGMLTTMRPWRDRVQFNAGWMGGRAAFVYAMLEAQRRGMSPVEWIIAEAERDGVLRVEVGERDE